MASKLLERSRAFNEAEENVLDFSQLNSKILENIENSNNDKVVELDINQLREFSAFENNQPFNCDINKVRQIANSIKEQGQLTPILVRRKKDGTYEILSGHTRKRALEYLGETKIKAIIVENIPDDVAFKNLAFSNIQREKATPSEIANLCRMSDLFKSNRQEFLTREEIANLTGYSRKHINRCLNVSKLVDGLKYAVDCDIISVTSVEDILFNLTDKEQMKLAEYIDYYIISPVKENAEKKEENIKYKKLSSSKLKKVFELAEFVRLNPAPNSLNIDFNIDGIKNVLSNKNSDNSDSLEETEENVSCDTLSDSSHNCFWEKVKNKFPEFKSFSDETLEGYILEILDAYLK